MCKDFIKGGPSAAVGFRDNSVSDRGVGHFQGPGWQS